jgi:adhesin transport system outer membrane protein
VPSYVREDLQRAAGFGLLFTSRLTALACLSLTVPVAAQEMTPVSNDAAGSDMASSASVASVPPKALVGPTLPVETSKPSVLQLDWRQNPADVPSALVDALEIIGQNYPSVRGAKAGLSAAAADIRGAKWQRFPSLSVETNFVDSGNRIGPAVAVSAPVWSGGRIGANIKRANAQFDASLARYREVVVGLSVEATQTYFEIARFARRQALLEESLGEHGKLVASMERRVAQEVSPLADLELARSRYAQIEQDLTVARAQHQAALFAFAELIGDPDYQLGNVPEYTKAIELSARETLMSDALTYDPTLRRLLAEVTAGRAEVTAAKAAIFPQLNAQYSYNDVFGSQVGFVARLETSGGLSRFAAVDGARARLENLTAQAGVAERQIRQRINSDLTEFDASQARAKVSLNASQISNRVSESYMRQFIAGRRSWLDVMNALRETLSARLGLADAEISSMSSFVRLSLRTGRWSPFSDNLK